MRRVVMSVRRDGRRVAGRADRAMCGCLAFFLVAASCQGQADVTVAAPADTNLTLAAAVEVAVRNNAQLKSLRARVEAMQERSGQAESLPNPMFTYGGMDETGGGSWPDTAEKRFGLEQEFPSFGKRGIRGRIASKDAEAMGRELESMARQVVMEVKETYFDLYALQHVIAITRQEEEVIKRIVTVAGTMYSSGDRSQADVLKAQTEVTMLKQKLVDFAAQENALKARLKELLNLGGTAPVGKVVTPPESFRLGPDTDAIVALAATNRPEVLQAQAQVERYELEKRLMKKESMPDYRLGVEYRDLGQSEEMMMFSVGIDLPLWRSKYSSGVREAEKMRESSEAEREAAERRSAFDAQDAIFKLKAAQQTLELYRNELVPQAEVRFDASEAGYRTGTLDFMDLLESQRFLLSARIMSAMAEGAVGVQAARLERAVGIAMPKVAVDGALRPEGQGSDGVSE